MRWVLVLGLMVLLYPLGSSVGQESDSERNPFSRPHSAAQTSSLKICLRLEDGTPFSGVASLHIYGNDSREAVGTSTEKDGETLFSDLSPGSYLVEASAPGFVAIKQKVDVAAGQSLVILYLTLKPGISATTPETQARPDGPDPRQFSWINTRKGSAVPAVEPGVSCPLPEVLDGAGRRMEEFASTLEKFSANEHVEHFNVKRKGARERRPETRSFEYFTEITQTSAGRIYVDEYRNGSMGLGLDEFPADLATEGLPAMALIFHRLLATDFSFTCDGLAPRDGRPAWQVRFEQRSDRPSRIRAYRIGGKYYPIPLEGRAWIDAGTYQVLRLESDLIKPIKAIKLAQEHIAIEYAPVQFHAPNETLWLPKTADLYVDYRGHRYYRRHAFSNFHLFTVNAEQRDEAPPSSYCFTNTSDHDISGVLTVTPAADGALHSPRLAFTISAGNKICKVVGPGKDLSIPPDSIGSATFVHSGPEGAVTVTGTFAKESTLDIIANSSTLAAQ